MDDQLSNSGAVDGGPRNDQTVEEDDETTEHTSSATKESESVEKQSSSKKKPTTIIRPNQKRNVPRSQMQALRNLATGVNKMAEINAKRLKMEAENEKERKKKRVALLEFRREEA